MWLAKKLLRSQLVTFNWYMNFFLEHDNMTNFENKNGEDYNGTCGSENDPSFDFSKSYTRTLECAKCK